MKSKWKAWTNEERAFLRENWTTMNDQQLADALYERFGRRLSKHAVYNKRSKMGLDKVGSQTATGYNTI